MLKPLKMTDESIATLRMASDAMVEVLRKLNNNSMPTDDATLMCKASNEVLKSENIQLQDLRMQERIDRHLKQLYLDYMKAGIDIPN